MAPTFNRMVSRLSTCLRRSDGQSMVEFAIVLLPLCLVLFGITQFGIVFKHYLQVTDAARVGARAAAVSRGIAPNASATACPAATTAAQNSATGITTTIVCEGSTSPGQMFIVKVQTDYSIDVLGIVTKSGVLEGRAAERIE